MGTIAANKPAYTVGIGSAYFNFIKSRNDTDTIEYDDEVIECPVIKTLGLSRTVTEGKIFASNIVYEFISQTTGAELALGAVALPPDILQKAEGATVDGEYEYGSIDDKGAEFAFGYWAPESDGEMRYYWHPVCKLVPVDEAFATREEGTMPDPNVSYRIVIIPFNGLWRTKYITRNVAADATPLTIAEFFATPLYKKGQKVTVPTAPAE